jgi:hypothetical protein
VVSVTGPVAEEVAQAEADATDDEIDAITGAGDGE